MTSNEKWCLENNIPIEDTERIVAFAYRLKNAKALMLAEEIISSDDFGYGSYCVEWHDDFIIVYEIAAERDEPFMVIPLDTITSVKLDRTDEFTDLQIEYMEENQPQEMCFRTTGSIASAANFEKCCA